MAISERMERLQREEQTRQNAIIARRGENQILINNARAFVPEKLDGPIYPPAFSVGAGRFISAENQATSQEEQDTFRKAKSEYDKGTALIKRVHSFQRNGRALMQGPVDYKRQFPAYRLTAPAEGQESPPKDELMFDTPSSTEAIGRTDIQQPAFQDIFADDPLSLPSTTSTTKVVTVE